MGFLNAFSVLTLGVLTLRGLCNALEQAAMFGENGGKMEVNRCREKFARSCYREKASLPEEVFFFPPVFYKL